MYQEILDSKLVPVVVFNSLEEVEPTLTKLISGGINVAEICFRTECALRGNLNTASKRQWFKQNMYLCIMS